MCFHVTILFKISLWFQIELCPNIAIFKLPSPTKFVLYVLIAEQFTVAEIEQHRFPYDSLVTFIHARICISHWHQCPYCHLFSMRFAWCCHMILLLIKCALCQFSHQWHLQTKCRECKTRMPFKCYYRICEFAMNTSSIVSTAQTLLILAHQLAACWFYKNDTNKCPNGYYIKPTHGNIWQIGFWASFAYIDAVNA